MQIYSKDEAKAVREKAAPYLNIGQDLVIIETVDCETCEVTGKRVGTPFKAVMNRIEGAQFSKGAVIWISSDLLSVNL